MCRIIVYCVNVVCVGSVFCAWCMCSMCMYCLAVYCVYSGFCVLCVYYVCCVLVCSVVVFWYGICGVCNVFLCFGVLYM